MFVRQNVCVCDYMLGELMIHAPTLYLVCAFVIAGFVGAVISRYCWPNAPHLSEPRRMPNPLHLNDIELLGDFQRLQHLHKIET